MNPRSIRLTMLLGFIFLMAPMLSVHAANPYGTHGWKSLVSDIVGDDASCGAGKVKQELYLRELGTGNPVTLAAGAALLVVGNLSDGTINNAISGTGPTISSVCYDPDTQYLAFDIDGGGAYHNFQSVDSWSSPGSVLRGKLMRTTIWLTPTSGGSDEYAHNSPVSVIVNTSPSFEINLNSFPSTYGATELNRAELFVLNVVSGTPDSSALYKNFSLSGGIGKKTMPPQTLADGIYAWGYYLRLNGSHDAGGQVIPNELTSGYQADNEAYFTLDTTASTITATSTPTSPYPTETVIISATSTDALAGVDHIKMYIDDVLAHTCDFASVSSAVCSVSAGPYSASTIHTYYAVATDAAGNNATTTTNSFTVAEPYIPPLSCLTPTTTLLNSAIASSGGAGKPQALYKSGNTLYVGASGGGGHNGLYIYDVSALGTTTQLSFFSTTDTVIGLTVDGNYAYLATYMGGLVIVDVSNPSSPVIKSELSLSAYGETWDVEVRGNYAYIAGGKGIIIADVSNKTNPTVVALRDAAGVSVSQNITVSGNYAYIALRDAGIAVVDISDLNSPTLVKQITNTFDASSWAYSTAVKNNYLYVGTAYSGTVRVYNISDQSNPVFVQSVTLPVSVSKHVRGLYVDDNVLYASVDKNGVYVFDITTPSNPVQLYAVGVPPFLSTLKIWDVRPINTGVFTDLVMVSEDVNAGVYRTTTQCAALPDLVSASTTVSVDSVNAGDPITFGAATTITPTSCGSTKTPYAGFYIDANNDGVSEYTAPVVRTPSKTCGPPASSVLRGDAVWTVPVNAPSGTYRVGYIANEPSAFAEATYTNNWSGWTSFTVVGNTPPLANAGTDKDITLPTESTAPTGVSVSDSDGSIASTIWSFVSGPGPTPVIVGESTLSPTFQALSAAGTYVFRLTVVDNLSATTTDDMQVVVHEDPTPTGWITATPNVVDAIGTSVITWGSTNATACAVTSTQNSDTWSGVTSTEGGETTSPLTIHTSYVLTCDSVLVASVLITVNPEVTINVSSKVVQNNGYVDVTWNTNGNDETLCDLTGGGLTDTLFDGSGSGTYRVPNITAKTKFTLTCGTQTDSIEVEVKPIGWES